MSMYNGYIQFIVFYVCYVAMFMVVEVKVQGRYDMSGACCMAEQIGVREPWESD